MAEDSETSNHADSLAESIIDPSTASTSTIAQEQAPPPPVNDPEATQTTAGPSNSLPPSSTTTSKRKNKWPAYFFPNLATQRMAFCIDALKREDIKSVCEFGCGPGAVLRPMTNGASHIDSFPEPIFDESALLAEAEEEEEDDNAGAKPDGEGEKENNDGEDETLHRSVSQAPSEQATEEANSIAPSDSASRRQSVQSIREVPEVSEEKKETEDGSSDSRGRSPPRGRGGFAPPPVEFVRSTSPEPMCASTKAILNMEILEKYRQLPGPRPQDKELHLRRIAGLDLTEYILLEAIDVTSPPPEEPSPFITYFDYSPRERWEDLRVELWQGSLDVYNDALDNFEAFVMTEVIEHLHARQLDKFPDLLFGSYRPRIVVITTPNYDFNQYFEKAKGSPSSAVIAADEPGTKLMLGEKPEDETKSSYKDPTGRTDRYFRNDDHKFEWTQQEFKQWCEMITSKYDYTVEVSGVGSLKNYFGKGGMYTLDESKEESQQAEGEKKVPPPHIQEILDSVPDPSKMFATQTAVFRRKFAYESERSPRSPIQMPLAFYGVKSRPGSGSGSSPAGRAAAAGPLSARKSAKQRSNENGDGSGRDYDSSASRSPDQRHKLLKAHYFKASPQAGNSKSAKEIRRVLDELMRDRMRARSASLRELWGRSEIAQVCGGYINKLVQALVLDKSKAWDIEFDAAALEKGGQVEDAVMIILKDYVEPERVYHNPFGDDHVAGGNDDEAEDEEEEEASRRIKGRSGGNESVTDSEDDDREYASRNDDDDDEKEATSIAMPKLSKKQRKQKRMEEAPFLLPIFPLEHEPTWMPAQGTQEAEVWDVWANPARASTMITEQEWAEESKTQQASGWD